MALSVPGLNLNFIASTRNGRRQDIFEVVIGSMSRAPIRHRPPKVNKETVFSTRSNMFSQYFVKYGQIIQARKENGMRKVLLHSSQFSAPFITV